MATKERRTRAPATRLHRRALAAAGSAISSVTAKSLVGALIIIAAFAWLRTGGLDTVERGFRAAADGVHAVRMSLSQTFKDPPPGIPN